MRERLPPPRELMSAAGLGLGAHIYMHYVEPATATRGLAILIGPPAILFIAIARTLDYHRLLIDLLLYLATLSLSIVVYRISPLHPLCNIPGPFWNKMTKISGMWMSWTGKQHVLLKGYHERYGPVVRTGLWRPNLSCISCSIVQKSRSQRSEHLRCRRYHERVGCWRVSQRTMYTSLSRCEL